MFDKGKLFNGNGNVVEIFLNIYDHIFMHKNEKNFT